MSNLTSTMPGKASSSSHSWLPIVLGLVAVAGVVGTISIAVVSFVILRSTTTTTISKWKSPKAKFSRICLSKSETFVQQRQVRQQPARRLQQVSVSI